MKNFIIVAILLIGNVAVGQKKECKLWLGDTYDSIDVIKATAEQYLQFQLKLVPNEDGSKTMYEMKDNEGFCQVKIWMKQKRVLTGTTMTSVYFINSIKVICLAERNETLFAALKEKVAACTTESTKMNAVFSTGKMSIENQGGDWSKKNLPMSTLTITPLN